MKAKMEERLKQLQTEYEAGQAMLEELNTRRTEVEQTMVRISGAIEVLKELIAQEDSSVAEG